MTRFNVAIVGSGLAGLTVALNLADRKKVGIVTKREFLDGASNWAQGGIAAVLAKEDSPEDHIRDTEIAGAGLCNAEITRYGSSADANPSNGSSGKAFPSPGRNQ
jgi:L-aspartate oxidase